MLPLELNDGFNPYVIYSIIVIQLVRVPPTNVRPYPQIKTCWLLFEFDLLGTFFYFVGYFSFILIPNNYFFVNTSVRLVCGHCHFSSDFFQISYMDCFYLKWARIAKHMEHIVQCCPSGTEVLSFVIQFPPNFIYELNLHVWTLSAIYLPLASKFHIIYIMDYILSNACPSLNIGFVQ